MQCVINLKLARSEVGADGALGTYLSEALLHAEAAAFELRQLVHEILPASLSRAGLRAGLESLIAGLDVPVRLSADVPRLPPAIETTAYLVAAEALANVARHAEATSASVDVAIRGAELVVAVADDGRGGAAPAAASGLTGLLDRVEAGGGTLHIASPPGGGTVLTVTLPLGGWTA
jgi:signal transduction histidine kinase